MFDNNLIPIINPNPGVYNGFARCSFSILYQPLNIDFLTHSDSYKSWRFDKFWVIESEYIRVSQDYNYNTYSYGNYYHRYNSRTWVLGPEFGIKIVKFTTSPTFFTLTENS